MDIKSALSKIMLESIKKNEDWYYSGYNERKYSTDFDDKIDGKTYNFIINASKKNISIISDTYDITMDIIGNLSNNETINYNVKFNMRRSSVPFNMLDEQRRRDAISEMMMYPGVITTTNKEFLAEIEEPLLRYASEVKEHTKALK